MLACTSKVRVLVSNSDLFIFLEWYQIKRFVARIIVDVFSDSAKFIWSHLIPFRGAG